MHTTINDPERPPRTCGLQIDRIPLEQPTTLARTNTANQEIYFKVFWAPESVPFISLDQYRNERYPKLQPFLDGFQDCQDCLGT